MDLPQLRRLIAAFVAARDWQQFHAPKNLSMAIAIEAAELMECYQWDDGPNGNPIAELADVLIYCLSMANALEIDSLSAIIIDKMSQNAAKYPPIFGDLPLFQVPNV